MIKFMTTQLRLINTMIGILGFYVYSVHFHPYTSRLECYEGTSHVAPQ
jgi:hypothetical protein